MSYPRLPKDLKKKVFGGAGLPIIPGGALLKRKKAKKNP
jgi:hypothetical protein